MYSHIIHLHTYTAICIRWRIDSSKLNALQGQFNGTLARPANHRTWKWSIKPGKYHFMTLRFKVWNACTAIWSQEAKFRLNVTWTSSQQLLRSDHRSAETAPRDSADVNVECFFTPLLCLVAPIQLKRCVFEIDFK